MVSWIDTATCAVCAETSTPCWWDADVDDIAQSMRERAAAAGKAHAGAPQGRLQRSSGARLRATANGPQAWSACLCVVSRPERRRPRFANASDNAARLTPGGAAALPVMRVPQRDEGEDQQRGLSRAALRRLQPQRPGTARTDGALPVGRAKALEQRTISFALLDQYNPVTLHCAAIQCVGPPPTKRA